VKDSIKFLDKNVAHTYSCSNGDLVIPFNDFEWYRGSDYRSVAVYTDECLNHPKTDSKIHIAWLLEPPIIKPYIYDYIRKNFEKFDLILTCDESLLSISPKFKLFPPAGTWVYPKDWFVYEKTKNVSIIASEKNYAPGHIYRHQIIDWYKNKFDFVCGRGYKKIDYKLEALKDFRYTFTMENCILSTYFTDRVIECFLTGTIPIYWGTTNITRYFNEDGIIFIPDDINKVGKIFDIIGPEDYDFRKLAILENFEIAKSWAVAEDRFYDQFVKGLK